MLFCFVAYFFSSVICPSHYFSLYLNNVPPFCALPFVPSINSCALSWERTFLFSSIFSALFHFHPVCSCGVIFFLSSINSSACLLVYFPHSFHFHSICSYQFYLSSLFIVFSPCCVIKLFFSPFSL